jgi:hypothetical protein
MLILLRLTMLCIPLDEIVVVESFDIVSSSDGMKNSIYDGDCVLLGWAGVDYVYKDMLVTSDYYALNYENKFYFSLFYIRIFTPLHFQ